MAAMLNRVIFFPAVSLDYGLDFRCYKVTYSVAGKNSEVVQRLHGRKINGVTTRMRFAKTAVTMMLVTLCGMPALAHAKSSSKHKLRHSLAHKNAVRTVAAKSLSGQGFKLPADNYILKGASAQVIGAPVTAIGLDAPVMLADKLLLENAGSATHQTEIASASSSNDGKMSAASTLVRAKASETAKSSKPADDEPQLVVKAGVISGKGLHSIAQAGVPQSVLAQVSAAFGRDPATRGVPPDHAEFHIVYEEVADAKARRKSRPELRLAALTVAGKEHRIYCYPAEHDSLAFVDGSGRGVMPIELASPVPGAPITSPFGWRIHPILDIRKFHEGVDFGAPTGTPVRAAEDGVVEDVGFRGNYGNYVRVRHSDQLETAYAHLNGFAPGVQSGTHVHRGQVIAYIGTTGWATGPHLYYEVIVNGEHLDPLRRDLALKVHFEGATLRRFKHFTDMLATRSRSITSKASSCLLPACRDAQDWG